MPLTTAQPEGSPKQIAPIETPTALQAFANIANAWSLTTEEQISLLGSPPRSTYFKWRKEGGALSKDTHERLSHILNIYRVLQILFVNEEDADRWMKKPNKAFGGKSALEYAMCGFAELIEVRRYLDAQRG
jgi:uncharacterized protein (DUF2384 family)